MNLFKTALPLALMVMATAITDVRAQSFKALHLFALRVNNGSGVITNWDGAQPYHTGLVLSSNQLYGTTYYGGANGRGTVFSVSTEGSEFAVLHTFTASHSPDYTNADGEYPQGALLLLGGTLYGTTLNGGTNSGGYGTLFSVGTDGTGFAALHSFNSVSEGRNPVGPLAGCGNTLYGMTEQGGIGGEGTAFALGTDGAGFTLLHALTNLEGNLPYSGLVLAGDTLYGTADFGGTVDNGTLFSVTTNGQNFTLLHAFSPADGADPEASLVLSSNRLFGTATSGGLYGRGTLFSVSTNGSDFRVLHMFTGGWDGAYPQSLLISGGVIYGVTETGGTNDTGTVFSLNTDGSGFTGLYSFSTLNSQTDWTNSDGVYPEGALVLSGNTLYGTTEQGGTGNGSVFRLKLVPSITGVALAGTNLVLSGINGVPDESCTVLMGTNLAGSANGWAPVATNRLTGNTFSIVLTNAVDLHARQRFFTLQVQ